MIVTTWIENSSWWIRSNRSHFSLRVFQWPQTIDLTCWNTPEMDRGLTTWWHQMRCRLHRNQNTFLLGWYKDREWMTYVLGRSVMSKRERKGPPTRSNRRSFQRQATTHLPPNREQSPHRAYQLDSKCFNSLVQNLCLCIHVPYLQSFQSPTGTKGFYRVDTQTGNIRSYPE